MRGGFLEKSNGGSCSWSAQSDGPPENLRRTESQYRVEPTSVLIDAIATARSEGWSGRKYRTSNIKRFRQLLQYLAEQLWRVDLKRSRNGYELQQIDASLAALVPRYVLLALLQTLGQLDLRDVLRLPGFHQEGDEKSCSLRYGGKIVALPVRIRRTT